MKSFLKLILCGLVFVPIALAGASFNGIDKIGNFLVVHFSTGDVTLPISGFEKNCAISGNYTVGADGCSNILVTTGSSTITVTLPSVVSNVGRVINIKKVDAGSGKITVNRAGSDVIEGNATASTITTFNMGAGASGLDAFVSIVADGASSTWFYRTYDDHSSVSIALTGARSTSETFIFARSGKIVTISTPRDVGGACTVAATLTSAVGALDPAYRPTRQIINPYYVASNSANVVGIWAVSADGSFNFQRDGINVFASTGNCGPYEGSISYPVN